MFGRLGWLKEKDLRCQVKSTLAWRIEAGRADWEQVGSFQKADHSDLKSENHLEDLGI